MGSDHFLSNVLGFHPCTVYMPLFRSKEEAAGSEVVPSPLAHRTTFRFCLIFRQNSILSYTKIGGVVPRYWEQQKRKKLFCTRYLAAVC